MTGNPVIHKPSELTPLTGKAIQELFERAEFPENTVTTFQKCTDATLWKRFATEIAFTV